MRIEQALELIADSNNIVFSGGCALNICANSVVQEEYPNINFYVDPIAGDACQSFGAAKIFHHERTQSTDIKPLKSIYQGIHQPPNSILKKQIELEVARQNNLSYN